MGNVHYVIRMHDVLLAVLTHPAARLFVLIALRKWLEDRRLEKSRKFSSDVCKMLLLPRELGWYSGGPIVAVLHESGQSAITHRRRLYMVPRVLQELGVDSWNITKDEAIAVIRTRPSRRS